MNYNHKLVEKKWQDRWEKDNLYSPDLENTKKENKFFNLWMFPYPSAEGLHAGHAFASTGSDVYGRYMRMNGKTVFQPIGYDSFGIHSENYAIKIGENPHEVVKRTTENYERQMRSLGHGYDWNRTVTTSSPDYYKWTQWLFIEMFKQGLAYRKKAEVNFCPSCKTVLADEQVMTPKQAGKTPKDKNGDEIKEESLWEELKVCERCGTVAEKRDLDQWFMRITDYADRLLEGLDTINWSPRVATAQKEWIGKSEGMKIRFNKKGSDEVLEVFTTRPDTLDSVTFLAIASKEFEPLEKSKEKLGKFTGEYAISPIDGRELPIWETNYVVESYGTGVVMGVPAYDERDMDFAKKYQIDILEKPLNDGLWQTIEKNKWGEKHTNYHLRDWLVSRQRYWGAPIPIIYCSKCLENSNDKLQITKIDGIDHATWVDENLPVLLPDITDYQPEGNGRGPLANHPEFYNVKCPKCGGDARRETDVMDTFVDSSWYFLRYPSVDAKSSNDMPFDADISREILPVDLYFGGAEHSVLHLMYARFVNMVMKDRGYLDHDEPFPKFFAHGLMIKDGAKMSKSRGNVVNPDTYIDKYGADTLRLYVMFMGPMDGYPDFRDSGIEGMSRFLKKVCNLYSKLGGNKEESKYTEEDIKTHKVIKGVTEDIENFRYNTAIAKIMELVNEFSSHESLSSFNLETLAQLIAPFAPHIAEELWQVELGNKGSIHLSSWPKYKEEFLKSSSVTYAIQINGKLRGTVTVETEIDKDKLIEISKSEAKVIPWLEGKVIKKEIYVPNKLVNFVV